MKKFLGLLFVSLVGFTMLACAASAGTLALTADQSATVVAVTASPPSQKTVEIPAKPGPVTLEVYDPSGAFEVAQLFAARLDTLKGKTICEINNGSWEYQRTFPLIRELLQKQFPTAKFIPYTEFPIIPLVTPVTATTFAPTIKLVKAKGCDAVITGNAG